MQRVLENDFLKVTIDDHGAELFSIYDKEKSREVLWQGDRISGDVMLPSFSPM